MIRKVTGGYVLVSKTTGRRLSKVTKSKEALKKRERQILFYKNDSKYMKDRGRHIPKRKKK